MNRSEETALAWDLLAATEVALEGNSRVWLVAQIGAGEADYVIWTVLKTCARRAACLPAHLFVALKTWAEGYAGSPEGRLLGDLIEDLQFPAANNNGTVHRDLRPSRAAQADLGAGRGARPRLGWVPVR